MKTLIVEDNFASRRLLESHLKDYGACQSTATGEEAVVLVEQHMDSGDPFDLICLDIMMPGMNGQEVLRRIREIEKAHGIRSGYEATIIMTTALDDIKSVKNAYFDLCNGYLVKPITRKKLLDEIRKFSLIP